MNLKKCELSTEFSHGRRATGIHDRPWLSVSIAAANLMLKTVSKVKTMNDDWSYYEDKITRPGLPALLFCDFIVVIVLVSFCGSFALGQDFFDVDNTTKIALLQSQIRLLEQENADLRAQLRARDTSKQPEPAEAKITMQSIPGCTACDQWFASEKPKLTAVGWIVDRETVKTWPAGRMFPRWKVCTGKSCIEIENCNASQFMNRLRVFVENSQPRM